MHLYVSTLLFALVTALLIPISAGAQTINGCVKDKNGALRVVADPTDCTSRETPISWNQVGPQGESGTAGADGAPGADGSDAEVLYVFDGNGVPVGRYAGGEPGGSQAYVQVFDEANGVLFTIWQGGKLLETPANMYYKTTDCSGVPYVISSSYTWGMAAFLYTSGAGRLFAMDTVRPLETITAASWLNNGVCHQELRVDLLVYRGREVFLDLSFPLPLPIYVGLPPEV
jgi:hypothetical protein